MLKVGLGNEPRSFYCFEIVPKYCISDSLVDYEGYSISSIVCHRILKIVPRAIQ